VICRNYSFQKLIQLSKGNNVLDATASSIHAFLCRGTWISLTQLNSPNGPNTAYLLLETPKIQEVFLSKTNTVLTGKQCASNMDGFFWEIHVFLQVSWIGIFGTRWASSTLKIEIFRVRSFQKLTEFSHGNTVLDVAASNIEVFLWRDTCGSLTQLNKRIYIKHRLSPPWNTKVAGIIPSINNSSLTGKQCVKCTCFQHRLVSFERYMCYITLVE
jgi:hypothetical protein